MLILSFGFFDSGFGISRQAYADPKDRRRKGFVIPMITDPGGLFAAVGAVVEFIVDDDDGGDDDDDDDGDVNIDDRVGEADDGDDEGDGDGDGPEGRLLVPGPEFLFRVDIASAMFETSGSYELLYGLFGVAGCGGTL